MNNKEKRFFKLTPFKMQVLQSFPFIDADFDALTNYELLCKVVEYLNITVDNVNILNDNVIELSTAFNNLKEYVDDYFDNLDVQEEINNKLDEMAESGQLTDIIAQYLGLAGMIAFDTVGDMKLAENLVNGSKCHTLGYYSINDNGSAIYRIRTKTNADVVNEMNLISLSDETLVAELVIVNDTINVDQLGAKGDNTQDDTDYLQTAFSLGATNITFGAHKTYLVKGYQEGETPTGGGDAHGVSVSSHSIVDLNYSTIKVIPNSRDNYKILYINGQNHVVVKNGYILGDNASHSGSTGQWGHGLVIRNSSNVLIENVTASLCWGDGFNIQADADETNSYITFRNCIADDNRRQGLSVSCELNDAYFENCEFINTGKTATVSPSAGVDFEPELNKRCTNVTFYNCKFNENVGSAIQLRDSNDIILDNCTMSKNISNNSDRALLIGDTSYNITVRNSLIDQTGISKYISQIDCSGDMILDNVTFTNALLAVRAVNNVKSRVMINNCLFNIDRAVAYNTILSLSPSSSNVTTDTGSELIINGCYFNFTADGNLREWIKTNADNYFNKIEITNNKFVKGRVAIVNDLLNSYIANNEFVQIEYQAISLSGATNTHVFVGNLFEQCGYKSSSTGIINNSATTNFILKDNNSTNHTLDSKIDIASPSHSPTAFLQTTSTADININLNNSVANI